MTFNLIMAKQKPRDFRRLLIFSLLAVVVLLTLVALRRLTVIQNIKFQLPKQIEQVAPKPLTEQLVIDQINSYRTTNKMLALTRNGKLDKAALSRLEVVKNSQDFSGEKTGLTRENAVRNNDYNYGVIGDLYAQGVSTDSNLVDSWSGDTNAKKTLNEKSFRDVGVKVELDSDTYKVMVILARKSVPVVEKLGAGGYPVVSWGGPEMWEAINKRRVELGVGQLSRKDELCTIASIRLNQLLELGKLDGHAGFEPTLSRPDLAWIRQRYNLSEFLIVGYPTPQEAVAGWEHTLGHKGLLAGGEYVWGCVYAQNTFAVAIAAY